MSAVASRRSEPAETPAGQSDVAGTGRPTVQRKAQDLTLGVQTAQIVPIVRRAPTQSSRGLTATAQEQYKKRHVPR